ncbi:hypothetical protein [Fundidesulfovibrio terrae]|uniref:hypothetical protein n=1 Tax=Fundidesulfovibrio terrae TaxID=2922866 RepID=UPI001FAFE577|nr:hypothetical protein [Fundidesulfovibrio terrae]
MPEDQITPGELPEGLTIPANLQFSARGFSDEDYAREMINKLHSILSVISQWIDLSNLDGVTLAFDYDEALAELDRGYEPSKILVATKDVSLGIAMAPCVIRDGNIKTHIVLNTNYILGLLEEPGQETECFYKSLYVVAHECAHVEVTAAFDNCFPGVILQKVNTSILDGMRRDVIWAAWQEYAACRISCPIGDDPSDGHLETLVKVLENTRSQCFEMIKAYRIHSEVDKVVLETYGKLGDLLKSSSYYLGTVASHEIPETHPDALLKIDEFDWFCPYYDRLIDAQQILWDQFGKWDGQDKFELLGDILEDMAESIGIEAERLSNERIYFKIPYRKESMPDNDLGTHGAGIS